MEQTDYQLYAVVFGLLHRPFLAPPKQDWLSDGDIASAFQRWPFADSADAATALANALESESQETIERDYYQLFIGPRAMKAPLNGSVYTDRDNLLFGQTCTEFSQFCQLHGIELDHQEGEASDNMGLMLGLLAHLLQHRQDLVNELLSIHLLPWAGRVFELMAQHASTEFYRQLALICANTLVELSTSVAAKAVERKLYF